MNVPDPTVTVVVVAPVKGLTMAIPVSMPAAELARLADWLDSPERPRRPLELGVARRVDEAER